MRYVVIFAILVLCPAIGLAQTPTVDIKCNGLDSGVLIDPGSNAKIDFSITAGSGLGNTVDIWIILETPTDYYSYNGFGPIQGWNKGIYNAYYTGSLADMTDTALDSSVPDGDYVAYVVIDAWADGFFDQNLIYTFDSVDFVAGIEGMAFIPAGEFEMGDHHGVGDPVELPVHVVFIDAFWMDIYQVTNQKYCDYLTSAYAQGLIEVVSGVVYKAGDTEPYCSTYSADPGSHIHFSSGVFSVTSKMEDHPMVMVSWYGAVAYANWRSCESGLPVCYDLETWECTFGAGGFRLPTEAEWEKAARGGEHNPYYKYPWGDSIDGSKANYLYSGDPFETGPYPWTTWVGYYDGNQIPSGVDMANGYGLYDMAGNVEDWCHDWYGSTYYGSSPYENPTGPSSGTSHVRRSGCWYYITDLLRCAYRNYGTPGYRDYYCCFRLALK